VGEGGSVTLIRKSLDRIPIAQLAGNPHLHRPTRSDFAPGPSLKDLSTVFAPPPSHFSRSTYTTPSTSTSVSDAFSKESGQFSMSLRGLRRNLRTGVVGNKVRRGEGGRVEEVLEIMERELQSWLEFQGKVEPGYFHTSTLANGKLLDSTPLEDYQFPPPPTSNFLPDEPVRSSRLSAPPPPPSTLVELTRLPHTLVWLAPSPQHRYLLHSLSRYYKLQSFSRPLSPLDSETRVTHILRPQLNKPVLVNTLGGGFETPSATDWSSASGVSTEVETTEISASEEEEESEAEFTEGTFTTDDEEGFTTDEGEIVHGRVLDELSSGGESDYGADRETGFTTDEGEDDDHTDSLASSFANLSTAQLGSAVPATPTSISQTPQRTRTPPFLPYTPTTSSSTPTPSTLATALSTARPVTRARGRRSLPLGSGGRDSLESSPSRSPTRGDEVQVIVNKGEWKMPERGFVDWVFEE